MVASIDIETQDSPGWYLNILMGQLHDRRVGRSGKHKWRRDRVASSKLRPGLELLDAYRRGDPPLRDDIHSGWAAPFRQYMRMGRLNFARKMVSPTANRMGLRGFQTAAADDELGDLEAQKIMRLNKLKLVSRDAVDHMLTFGDGYTMITPPDAKRDYSLITAESPLQCITGNDPATGETRAGLKVFRDDWDAADWAYLLLPGKLYVARKNGPSSIGHQGPFRFADTWEWHEEKWDDIPGNRVPMVRFRNERGVGEFEEHLNHLDRINDKVFNEWWLEKIQAFRQRALERDGNVDEEDDLDVDGDPSSPVSPSMGPDEVAGMFLSSPDALWDLPPGAKLWESTPVDVTPLINSIQKELQWLAAAGDKPLSSLNPDAANQSAEGSANQKEEHLYQVEDRRDRAEVALAETMSHAFFFQDDEERADVTQIEVLWGPIERFSLEQRSQAASQANTSLPREAIQRDIWQYDPSQIPELRSMAGRDLLFQAPGQPPTKP